MPYFYKSMIAHILSAIMVFVLMGYVPNAIAAKSYIPGLLRVTVNTKMKNANGRIDQFLRKYGKRVQILYCKKKRSKKSFPCGSNSKFPYRKIRVRKGHEKAWMRTLRKSRLVRRVIRVRGNPKNRLPGETAPSTQKVADDPCSQIAAPFFSITEKGPVLFDKADQFVKNTYQAKCGDCVKADEPSENAKAFSIASLNQEVVKKPNLAESLTLTFLLAEDKELITIVSGQYGPIPEKGKSVPKTEFKEMRCQYEAQLKAYANELQGKLQQSLKTQ
jgi:hypothetical protein